MKFLILLLFVSHAFAQGFKLIPTDKTTNHNAVPEGVMLDGPDGSRQSLTPAQRDVILDKYLKHHIQKFDEVDKDILYKSIIHYSQERLLKKYPFIKDADYGSLKRDLH